MEGKPCQPFANDLTVGIPGGNALYPDVVLDCGDGDDESLVAAEPSLVVEVLPPSTRQFDLEDKLSEYRSVPAIQFILLVDPNDFSARLFLRYEAGGWDFQRHEGADAVIDLPKLGLSIPLSALYARLTFEPKPRLIVVQETPATR